MSASRAPSFLPKELRDLPKPALSALAGLAGTVALAVAVVPLMLGALSDADHELSRLRAQTTQTQQQAALARNDHDFVVENAGRYEEALQRGVLDPQDRLAAKARLDQLLGEHHLVALTYEMAAARSAQGEGPAKDHVLVSTPLTVQAGAMLDRDLFTFMRDLGRSFPGFAVLKEMRLARQRQPTLADLDAIRAGTAVRLFDLTAAYEWRTAVPPADTAKASR